MNVIKSVTNYFHNLWRPSNFQQPYGGIWWNPINLKDYWNGDEGIEHFLCVPELNAIINMTARAFSSGVLKVVNDKGEEQPKDPLNLILQNPNWLQGQREFLRQTKTWRELYADEFIYLFYPVGFDPGKSLKAMYTLPPNLVCAEMDESTPYFLHKKESAPQITYTIKDKDGNKEYVLKEDSVIHMHDNNVVIKKLSGKVLINGQSKIKALRAPINNIRMAYESRGVILKYRGALGILSNDTKDVAGSVAVDSEERNRLQQAYQNYGGLDGQFQIIISNANLKWQQMSISPDKLGLFQECEEDFNKMLDVYNVPSELFVRVKGATYENRREAEKGFYQNNIIPSANEWVGALNNALMYDSKNKIIVDYSHLPIFQEDLKIKSDALNGMVKVLSQLLQDKQITIEEYRSELGKIGIGNGKPIPVETVGDTQQVETQRAQANLRGSVGGVQGVISIQQSMTSGATTRESAISMLVYIYGFTEEQANQIVGQPIQPEVQEPQQPELEQQEESQPEQTEESV